MSASTLLRAQHLTLAHGSREAAHDVSFEVGRGECVALVGANGAGKSTVMTALVGIHPMRSGTLEFDGRDVTGWRPADAARRGLVLCPEGRHLFPGMSIADNVAMGMARSGLSRADRHVRRRELEALFPVLAERSTQLAGTLSGGEQQMVALGRALAARPQLLILDEPTLGLAPLMVDKVFEIVRTVLGTGTSVLIAEQNVAATLEVADRAYVLEAGVVVSEGAAAHVAADPRLSAAFMGT